MDAYQGMVFAIALNITGNYADREDVVQEAFLCGYRKLRTLSDPSKFASWLCRAVERPLPAGSSRDFCTGITGSIETLTSRLNGRPVPHPSEASQQ